MGDEEQKGKVDLSDIKADLARVTVDPFKEMEVSSITNNESGGESAGRLQFPASMIEPTPMPDPIQLAKKIEQLLMSNIMQYASSYIGEQVGDLLSPPSLADITSLMSEKMGGKLITPADAISAVTKAQEELEDTNIENGIKDTMDGLTKDINKNVADVKKNVNGIVDYVKEWATNIQNVIAKGPNWIEAQVDNINNNAQSIIQEKVSSSFDMARKKKKDVIDGLAEKMASSKAAKMNELVMNEAFEMIKQPQQLIAKAKTQAMGVAKDTLLNMMATLGL